MADEQSLHRRQVRVTPDQRTPDRRSRDRTGCAPATRAGQHIDEFGPITDTNVEPAATDPREHVALSTKRRQQLLDPIVGCTQPTLPTLHGLAAHVERRRPIPLSQAVRGAQGPAHVSPRCQLGHDPILSHPCPTPMLTGVHHQFTARTRGRRRKESQPWNDRTNSPR